MSENYRSRTERKHAKQQTKDKNKKDKPKKKGSFFQEIFSDLPASWHCRTCSWSFSILCHSERCSKARQSETCQSSIN